MSVRRVPVSVDPAHPRRRLGPSTVHDSRPQRCVLARRFVALLLLAGLALFPACKMNRFIADKMTTSLQDQALAFERETNVKQAREAGPGMLKMLDGFLISSPDNPDLLLAGARMNTTFAFALIEEEDPARARDLYARARGYGERLLARRKGLPDLLRKGGPELDAALAGLGKKDLGPLFWTAFAWGSAVNLQRNSAEAVADLPTVQAVMQRVLALDETYHHAGPHLFFGVTYGSRTKAMGGDPDRSREHFEACLRLTGRKFLLAQVLYARCYAVGVQDRGLFTKLLEEVRDAPADLDPEQALANAIAKERAGRLLKKIDDLFLPDLPDEGAAEVPGKKP